MGSLNYDRTLPNMTRRIHPITALLKLGASFEFTSAIENIFSAHLAELTTAPISVTDKSRRFRLHCNASTTHVGATLENKQRDGSIRTIVYISRASLANEYYSTPIKLEAGWLVWKIRRLRRDSFGVFYSVYTDHELLQQIRKVRGTKPRAQP